MGNSKENIYWHYIRIWNTKYVAPYHGEVWTIISEPSSNLEILGHDALWAAEFVVTFLSVQVLFN